MEERVNVRSIVAEQLRRTGAEGLCNDLHGCGCSLDDLMECDFAHDICRPAIGIRCQECGATIWVPLWQKGDTA